MSPSSCRAPNLFSLIHNKTCILSHSAAADCIISSRDVKLQIYILNQMKYVCSKAVIYSAFDLCVG